ncbi:MAG: hypothetical protein LBK42_09085 [Propionibacteriaceae bacterium]|jgi:hypothetical protein|nr:hypothetical protein [Propionibacteriaceae bacterium]
MADHSQTGQSQTGERLQELRRQVVAARSVPMSASCMINREELLASIDQLSGGLQADLDDYARHHTSGDQARAGDIIAQARQEAGRIVSQTEIVAGAKVEAAQIQARARAESEELLVEADRYVETRLAAFEAELQVTMSRVAQMRERLLNRSQLGDDLSGDPGPAWPTGWDS